VSDEPYRTQSEHEEEAMPKPKYILELTRTDGCPVSHLGAVLGRATERIAVYDDEELARRLEQAKAHPEYRVRYWSYSEDGAGDATGCDAVPLRHTRKTVPWDLEERRLLAGGYDPYYDPEDEARLATLVCCRCGEGLTSVGMRKEQVALVFGICRGCRSWLWFLADLERPGEAKP
jgi:hypothetical protein